MLKGKAPFMAPEQFEGRPVDRRVDVFAMGVTLWEEGDASYYALSDALQHLGNVAFRAPVPAYKHSAAVFLQLTGRIPSPRTHPNSPKRPTWEADILRDCAARLGIVPAH